METTTVHPYICARESKTIFAFQKYPGTETSARVNCERIPFRAEEATEPWKERGEKLLRQSPIFGLPFSRFHGANFLSRSFRMGDEKGEREEMCFETPVMSSY